MEEGEGEGGGEEEKREERRRDRRRGEREGGIRGKGREESGGMSNSELKELLHGHWCYYP